MTSVLLVENLFSTIQFPSHTVTANAEATGFEVAKLANGRRSDTDYWAPTTAATAAWAKVLCNQMRAADMIVIDRGHNLAGKVVKLEASDDDFATTQTVFSISGIPSLSTPGDIDDGLGILTEEGAWVKRFPLRSALYWRLYVDAVASYIPQVVGLWLGKSYAPQYLNFPLVDEETELIGASSTSDYGWTGTGEQTERRTGSLYYKHPSEADYDESARYHLAHFKKGRPMWIVHDEAWAQRAVLARRGGAVSSPYTASHIYRETSIPWTEWEPL